MRLSLNNEAATTKWVTVKLESGDGFELKIKKPSIEDQMRRHAHNVAVARSVGDDAVQSQVDADMHAIKSTIVDWRGVEDDNEQKLGFSHSLLLKLMSQHNCATRVLSVAYSAFGSAFDGKSEKNSEEPRSESSAAET